MTKLDLRKELKHLYQPSAKAPVVIEVPEMKFLMIDGVGDPNTSQAFQEAMGALYGMSYTMKFTVKLGPLAVDYPVMALEGLWWTEDGVASVQAAIDSERAGWQWTMMMMQPDLVTPELVEEVREKARQKRNSPSLDRVRLESFHEGLAVQIMHLGPYAEELPTIERMHAFAEEQGYDLRGKHHEIYLGDPRRANPEKLRTVLRHPVEKLG